MKKNLFKWTMFFLLVMPLTQCQKSSFDEKATIANISAELLAAKTKALTTVLTAAKEPEFREFILSECLQQKHGDYNVYLKDVISAYRGKSGYESFISTLEPLVLQLKQLTNGREPLIFYPRAETIEGQKKKRSNSRIEMYDPVGVYEDVFNPIDYSSPGYIVNDGYNLVYFQDITEEYAWENDVWVLGQEENVSPENMVAAPEDMNNGRVNGGAEYGGLIQVTDINAIEHWTSGKLEFKVFVLSSTGITVSIKPFGKWKRSHFRDSKWFDFNHFITNWNTSNWGNFMVEKWIEEDGGQSAEVSISIPPPSGQTGPTTTIKFPSKNNDDDLGSAAPQFTDPINQIYYIGYMDFKRKNP